MNPNWVQLIADSKDAALVLSLLFNVLACEIIRRLWKSREALQDKVTAMLTDLIGELAEVTRNLTETKR